MSKPFIPRPCIRRVDLSTGEKFSLELPSGNIVASFVREDAAKLFAKKSKLHHEYGRCFFEYAPGKFEAFIEDERDQEPAIHADMPNSED